VKRFYPAVLERAGKGTFAVWFPDFPECVAAGRTQEEAIAKAEKAVAGTVEAWSERERPLPAASAIDAIAQPKGFIAYIMVGVEPPDPSERVNIYLPKSLLTRADQAAAQLGMSRSSFFGFALSMVLGRTKQFLEEAMRVKAFEKPKRPAR
jgi:predicted RNase H-like HicB family nuclease